LGTPKDLLTSLNDEDVEVDYFNVNNDQYEENPQEDEGGKELDGNLHIA